MSRLYGIMDTDAIKNRKTARAHKEVSGTVLFGCKGDSNMAMEYRVNFYNDMDRPKLILELNGNVDIQINGHRFDPSTGKYVA